MLGIGMLSYQGYYKLMPPIKDFRCKSIVIRRLSYSNQTLAFGGVTVVVSEPGLASL